MSLFIYLHQIFKHQIICANREFRSMAYHFTIDEFYTVD